MKKIKKTYKELALEFKKTKSEKSFTELYYKMKPGLRNYVNKILKDPELTDDVVSTTFISIYLKIDQYNPDYQITTWAYRIAYNECIGQIRARNKKVSMNAFSDKGAEVTNEGDFSYNSLSLNYNADSTVEYEHLERERILEEKMKLTFEAIGNLPKLYRPYMEERFLKEKSYNDIYEKMSKREKGISLQTVKNRIFRGKKIIQKELSNNKAFLQLQ